MNKLWLNLALHRNPHWSRAKRQKETVEPARRDATGKIPINPWTSLQPAAEAWRVSRSSATSQRTALHALTAPQPPAFALFSGAARPLDGNRRLQFTKRATRGLGELRKGGETLVSVRDDSQQFGPAELVRLDYDYVHLVSNVLPWLVKGQVQG